MTLPKKGTRKIIVEGKKYLWRLSTQRFTVIVCDPRTDEIECVNLPHDEESLSYQDNYTDECTDPVTPADAEAAIRIRFLKQKIALPTAEQRRKRRKLKPEPVPLRLNIAKATIVRKEMGEDEVILHLPQADSKTILNYAVGQNRAEEVYNNEFYLHARVTRGAGVALLAALGLDTIETITVEA